MKLTVKFSILFLVLFFPALTHAQGPINLTKAKADVAHYYLDGQYDAEVDSIMNDALVQLRGLKTSAHDVVVLDVDETTIANLPHVLSMDFGFRLDIWNAWVKEAKAKAIPQVKRFYDTLVAKGIKVIFLTGRMDEFAAATKTNLVSQGYTVYDTIITRFTGDGFQSTGSFKTATRKKIEENGYHIIMCIGDQESDLQGGHTGIKVKLPDFLYIIE